VCPICSFAASKKQIAAENPVAKKKPPEKPTPR
jgi:hypothetical protein